MIATHFPSLRRAGSALSAACRAWEQRRVSTPAALGVLVAVLIAGAVANRFPLIFPDSGAYLGIAFGSEYALDRSSFYGLFLKGFINLLPGVWGLWFAVLVQVAVVATILLVAIRVALPRLPLAALLGLAAMLLLSALPWQAGQFMPDAFTGALVLVVWCAARRDLGQDGTLLLWLAALALALTHYTHLPLLAVTAAAVIVAEAAAGVPLRACAARAATAGLVLLAACAILITANGAALGRWRVTPLGPVFLFARLNEDGLMSRYLDRHCGRDAPALLCGARDKMPVDSQVLLWRANDGIVFRHIWYPAEAGERWRWIDAMARANTAAILEQPLRFAAASLRGAGHQLVTYQALDDECPCTTRIWGAGRSFAAYRPQVLPALDASGQGERFRLPIAQIRAVTTPLAALALLAMPLLLALAWRRRDPVIASLVAAVAVSLLANAALAGALSDVHDRYQARLVWLAPFVVLLAVLRWRDPKRTRLGERAE